MFEGDRTERDLKLIGIDEKLIPIVARFVHLKIIIGILFGMGLGIFAFCLLLASMFGGKT
jgi:uncharacterized membrane protein